MARAELAQGTGYPQPEAAGSPPQYDIDSAALRSGLEEVPSLKAFEATSRQADADLAAAKAEKRPDWSWQLAYQHRDPMWGDMVSVGASVSLPLFAAKRQDPVIAARTQAASRVRIEREAARRALAASLQSDLADHTMHHDRLERARTTLAPLAQRRADLETASYAAGTASLSDVLGAFLAVAETQIDLLEREAAVARDSVRIVLTYGSQTP
jgi:outer membrane protein TolC